MKGVAGVPPDYFNSNGQLWGMPVFRWDVISKEGYEWWLNRIGKNLELYDELRLDHFRAFAEFWEVPAGEKTAKHGKWQPGPAAAFFTTLKKVFRSLPFVAEDLGDVSDSVYKLRDRFKLPGMKVLQFAFGENMPESDHIPHNFNDNFIAYTGTHDNNTTRGWFRKEMTAKNRQRLEHYSGQKITEKNVHLILARMAFGSVANTVILLMQDLLGLDESARINTPASVSGNWLWRLREKDINDKAGMLLKGWTLSYGRV